MFKMRLPFRPFAGQVCFLVLMVCGAAELRGAVTYPIEKDTQIDSRSSSVDKNYGVYGGLKVYSNSADNPLSMTHALIDLPDALDAIPADNLVSVKLWVNNYGMSPLGGRAVELHPLTRGFVEGTENGGTGGTGATWNTYNGADPWTTPGGDYGGTHVDVTAPVTGTWYAFDITPLLTGADRANLLTNGVLLKLSDETTPGGNLGHNFASSNNSTTGIRPYVEVTAVPEPASAALLCAAAGLLAVLIVKRRAARA